MTPDERRMLAELADKIAQTPVPAHDPEADEFIRLIQGAASAGASGPGLPEQVRQ